MMIRPMLHRVRDIAVRSSTLRPFRAINSPNNRIVVVRPDHFGDLLMLTPALRFLRHHAIDHEISLMIGPWNQAVAEHLAPGFEIQQFPFPGFSRDGSSSGIVHPYQQINRAAELLREHKPQVAVLMRDDHWWGAWMTREAGVPIRVGYNNRQMAPFLSHPLDVPRTHYVEQNLELARRTLAMLGHEVPTGTVSRCEHRLDWPVDTESQADCRRLLAQHQVSSPYAVLHPGTGAQVKLWAAERWATVIDHIANETGLQVLLTGTAEEHDLCHEVASASGAKPVNLAGKSSLFVLAELMREAAITLGVDSGPLHLSTAVGTLSIHLYGPSDAVRYGPWGDQEMHRVINAGMTCPRCGDLSETRPAGCGCMMAITPDQVVQTAIEMLRHEN